MKPDPALLAKLHCVVPVADGQDWIPLSGGQTNQLWRVGPVVVKRFSDCQDNPRFPNDPMQEVSVLRHLQGLNLCQDLLGHFQHDSEAYLVFNHLRGHSWRQNSRSVAQMLRRVHGIVPAPGLRRLRGGSDAIEQQVESILPSLPVRWADKLAQVRPAADTVPVHSNPVLLHGDPVPGNIIDTPSGLRLIDWQCPAVGDPVEDLALFMSPAMQLVYRGHPLSQAEVADFTDAYGDASTIRRLFAMRPWHHWAMAAYCAWKGDRGTEIYTQAAELELIALEQCHDCSRSATADQDS